MIDSGQQCLQQPGLVVPSTISLCLQPVGRWFPGNEPQQTGKCFQTRQLQYKTKQVFPTSHRDQLGGDNVRIQNRGGLVKYEKCLIFCQSSAVNLETTTDPLLPIRGPQWNAPITYVIWLFNET